ncbi:MAG: response regulator [Planctomycetaceae bacterium]|nr:response regulator [Planctomycetaceae bacterium]
MSSETVGRPMEILLVEDSLPAARLTMGALKRGGIEHRLTWLSDGDEASRFLHREGHYARAPRPDLILLDLMLPGRDGRELLQEAREISELTQTPVVVMTGTASEEQALGREHLDVQGFLTKPVDLEKFLTLVERLKDYWKTDMILPTTATRS